LSLSNVKGANLCLKFTKVRLAAGLRSDPLWELMRPPDPLAAIGGLLLRGTEGREEKREGTERETGGKSM